MRVQPAMVKSGYEPKLWTLGEHFVDHFLRIIDAAAALHFAAETSVRPIGRTRALSRCIADLVLRDSIADTNDHGAWYNR